MKTYINKGSKNGKKDYLVVKGSRVYTGQKFEATEKDVEKLRVLFNIVSPNESLKKESVKKTQINPIEASSDEKKEDTSLGFEFKSNNSVKGVK